MFLIGQSLDNINQVKEALKVDFDIKELGPVKGWVLKENKENNWVFLNQEGYVQKILSKFSIDE